MIPMPSDNPMGIRKLQIAPIRRVALRPVPDFLSCDQHVRMLRA